MKIIKSFQQNTPEWIEWRKNKIGSSDASIILNVSPWTSPMQLWERKLDIAPEQKESLAMSRGKALEHEARCEFIQLKNMSFAPEIVQHAQHDFLIASLDGLSVCEKYAVEIKCSGREDHLLALQGIVPKKYVPQLQHQLAVTGLDMIYYYSYDGVNNACIEVQRDQEYIDKLIQEELKFYTYMVTCTPPELSACDYNIRTDDKWQVYARDWIEAHEKLKWWQDHEKAMRQDLIEASQSQNSKGCGVKVQKIMRSGAIDYSKIKELEGIDLDQYRKPETESWRITIDG
jgi:putative phage-type endonuclease